MDGVLARYQHGTATQKARCVSRWSTSQSSTLMMGALGRIVSYWTTMIYTQTTIHPTTNGCSLILPTQSKLAADNGSVMCHTTGLVPPDVLSRYLPLNSVFSLVQQLSSESKLVLSHSKVPNLPAESKLVNIPAERTRVALLYCEFNRLIDRLSSSQMQKTVSVSLISSGQGQVSFLQGFLLFFYQNKCCFA